MIRIMRSTSRIVTAGKRKGTENKDVVKLKKKVKTLKDKVAELEANVERIRIAAMQTDPSECWLLETPNS